eukprot:g9031.t1
MLQCFTEVLLLMSALSLLSQLVRTFCYPGGCQPSFRESVTPVHYLAQKRSASALLRCFKKMAASKPTFWRSLLLCRPL